MVAPAAISVPRTKLAVDPETNSYQWKTTRRMYPLRPHPVQRSMVESSARFKIVPAGRRSGKTERAKRLLIKALFDCHPWSAEYKPPTYNGITWDDPHFFAAAPTRDQAKRIWWNDLKCMIHKDYVSKISESELTIYTKWGASLSVVGLDKPERIEGSPWDGGVVDEIATCKPGIFDANIRPALSDRNGWLILLGVPDMDAAGQVEYKKRVDAIRARDPKYSEWQCFTWPSSDIVDPAEIASAMRTMDPQLFAQEYGGDFVLAGGLAFPSFDLATHIQDDEAVYDHNLPVCISWDFNVNPFCFGIIQHSKAKGIRPRVIHEFRLTDSDTNVACNAFFEWYEKLHYKPPSIHIYGDASGNARDSTSGVTDWVIIQKMLKNLQPRFNIPSANPPIKDTVNAVRARLKNAAGDVGMVIHSQATRLISDLQEALWPDDLMEQHSLAWLRYFLAQEYPVGYDIETSDGFRHVSNNGAYNRGRPVAAVAPHLTASPRVVR